MITTRIADKFNYFVNGLLLFLIASTQPAYANVGVPMLAVMALPMWALLLLIIPLEAYFARKILRTTSFNSWWISIAANVVSTIFGVPLTWVVLTAISLGVQYVESSLGLRVPIHKYAGVFGHVVANAAWVPPYIEGMHWMVPLAALILLLPFFFVSTWIEYRVALLVDSNLSKKEAWDWSWLANRVSYIGMAGVVLCCLAYNLAVHVPTPYPKVPFSLE